MNARFLLCFCLLILACGLSVPGISAAKPLDGLTLENQRMMKRGSWDLKFDLEFGAGAAPLKGPVRTTTSKDDVEVDFVRVPLEVRYGLTDRMELGWSVDGEFDKGVDTNPVNFTGNLLNQGGLGGMRLFVKWKLWPRVSWMWEMAMFGNNALLYGRDNVDFGVKFMYGPKLGPGVMNVNLGVVSKGGNPDINDNGVKNAADIYDNVISFGIGYAHEWSDRWEGLYELAGSTSPFKGGFGVESNAQLAAFLGVRFSPTNRFSLTAGGGFGVLAGSPNFSFRIGLSTMFGNIRTHAQARQEESDFWQPTEEDLAQVLRRAEKAAAPAGPGAALADRTAEAMRAFDRRDYVAAAAHYEAAVAMKPDDAMLRYNLATTYFVLRRYSDAYGHYFKATELNPSDVDSHLYLGYTLYYLKNIPAARRAWEKVLEIDPTNEIARNNLESLGAERP